MCMCVCVCVCVCMCVCVCVCKKKKKRKKREEQGTVVAAVAAAGAAAAARCVRVCQCCRKAVRRYVRPVGVSFGGPPAYRGARSAPRFCAKSAKMTRFSHFRVPSRPKSLRSGHAGPFSRTTAEISPNTFCITGVRACVRVHARVRVHTGVCARVRVRACVRVCVRAR
jgi:hypothetical protein